MAPVCRMGMINLVSTDLSRPARDPSTAPSAGRMPDKGNCWLFSSFLPLLTPADRTSAESHFSKRRESTYFDLGQGSDGTSIPEDHYFWSYLPFNKHPQGSKTLSL